MTDLHSELPNITPEKLTMMKIRAGGFEQDLLSEPGTPSRERGSMAFGHSSDARSSSVTRRTSRALSGSSRRNSFMASHRISASKELTSGAEGKFFALMDLMSTASREASSLKESFSRIIAERDALFREREELLARVEEITETVEIKEREHSSHGHEAEERKRQVEKLLVELSVALAAVAEHKKHVGDRDRQLEQIRLELVDLQGTLSHTHGEHNKIRAELEALFLKFKAAEHDRDHAREDALKHHGDLRNLLREHTDLKSKYFDTNTKFETSRKDVVMLQERILAWELERDELLHAKDRLNEDHKRLRLRADDTARELLELTERHDRVQRDFHKSKEILRIAEDARDEYHHTIDVLRRELKVKSLGWEEADQRVGEITLQHEHIKREVVSLREKLLFVETERNDLRDRAERSREELRVVVIERDQLRDDVHDGGLKIADGHRRTQVLEEALRLAELAIVEHKSDIHSLNSRIAVHVRDDDEHRSRHGHLTTELAALGERLLIFQADNRALTDARDRAHRDLESWRSKYDEVTETMTEYQDGSGELEFEIESMRTLLHEVREEKEVAISARHAADRERDAMYAKYEEKCREMERFIEESAANSLAASRSANKSSFSRTVTHSSSGQQNSGHSHGHNGGFSSP
ncbi:hypothetical protein P153DRAFT_348856 [Dothidotthia symphoricarpi CBS 119687]|uniref:Uncharacterized protein n=1 Tax=Dothidotthia symphoricarpi CBS 119687 TaxID=1392245 RepID=A0A6A6A476_9PLEO|nr:uncharacterized protein P153DRAFT_348856 [Dothidotthia symphoricarpi CBS 119687]KAF2125558.1 hypothetical protein P153DRAFT_348856 [Dothidotthia symphoricarpi CBS 119687]